MPLRADRAAAASTLVSLTLFASGVGAQAPAAPSDPPAASAPAAPPSSAAPPRPSPPEPATTPAPAPGETAPHGGAPGETAPHDGAPGETAPHDGAPEDPDDAPEPDDQLRAIGEPETDPSQHRYFPLNVGLLYPLSTNLGDPNRSTNLDVGVLYTKIGYLNGLQLAGLASVSQEMNGVQIGAVAISEGRTRGVQIAGTFALADERFDGLQLAGVFNWGRFRFNGVQIAGAANQARKRFAGLQLAGGVNIARKTVLGAQIGGLLNIGAVHGLQLAPVNIASEVRGVQIGLVNIARKVTGLQIGLVNIAGEVAGESFGMASLPREGGIHGVAWGSNSLYGNFGIKFASHFTYSIFSGSFHFEGDDKLFAPGFTFGLFRRAFLEDLFVNVDFGGYRLFKMEGPQRAHDELFKTRVLVRYALAKRLSFFAGAGAYLGVRSDPPAARWGPEFDAGLEL